MDDAERIKRIDDYVGYVPWNARRIAEDNAWRWSVIDKLPIVEIDVVRGVIEGLIKNERFWFADAYKGVVMLEPGEIGCDEHVRYVLKGRYGAPTHQAADVDDLPAPAAEGSSEELGLHGLHRDGPVGSHRPSAGRTRPGSAGTGSGESPGDPGERPGPPGGSLPALLRGVRSEDPHAIIAERIEWGLQRASELRRTLPIDLLAIYAIEGYVAGLKAAQQALVTPRGIALR